MGLIWSSIREGTGPLRSLTLSFAKEVLTLQLICVGKFTSMCCVREVHKVNILACFGFTARHKLWAQAPPSFVRMHCQITLTSTKLISGSRRCTALLVLKAVAGQPNTQMGMRDFPSSTLPAVPATSTVSGLWVLA